MALYLYTPWKTCFKPDLWKVIRLKYKRTDPFILKDPSLFLYTWQFAFFTYFFQERIFENVYPE